MLCFNIDVGLRDSPLSKMQLKEIEKELKQFYPFFIFIPHYVKTTGDFDKITSLRHLGKSDFFTKQIDELQIEGRFRIAIHSAKDLPDPVPSGLKIAALTRGVDPSDSLVLREGKNLQTLETGAKIAVSSQRREESVRILRPDVTFVDIRGTIDERLAMLRDQKIDGLVVAEAALIRLNLTHLDRIKLPGESTPLQGRLAVLIRENDEPMEKLFSVLHFHP